MGERGGLKRIEDQVGREGGVRQGRDDMPAHGLLEQALEAKSKEWGQFKPLTP